eukprot:TRINITY_DN17191_c0_g1_i1.p1 TRINITY_DN17191_c0_g1~~TRINITY_DN17191_c0_g1_i1.p1  ORF type:complete len:367 (-),score=97.16 TRINITY_DN17191_c0_g1_i1:24-1124(-)
MQENVIGKYFTTLDVYKGVKGQEESLPFKKGEILVVRQIDGDNYKGENQKGKLGWFPKYLVNSLEESKVPKKVVKAYEKLDEKKKKKESKNEPKEPTSMKNKKDSKVKKDDNNEISQQEHIIEFTPTALLKDVIKKEELSVKISHRKTIGELRKMKIYKGPLFGIPLAHLMWLSYTEYTSPPVLIDALDYLDREEIIKLEGLFRESGDQEEIQMFKNLYDNGEMVSFDKVSTPHSVASLVKLFFRKLPEPLFTFKEYDNFKNLSKIEDNETRIKTATKIISDLPVINRYVIWVLFDYIYRVSLDGKVNKMVPENLGIVWGPTVLWQKDADPMEQTISSQTLSNVVSFIIEFYPQIMSSFENEFKGK